MSFYSFDLDPITLILILDLDMVKIYLCIQNEVPNFNDLKVMAWTDRDADRNTEPAEIIAYPHMLKGPFTRCDNICNNVNVSFLWLQMRQQLLLQSSNY